MAKIGLKNLTKGQKIALVVAAVVLLSSGAVGAFFGVKKHNANKTTEVSPKTESVAE